MAELKVELKHAEYQINAGQTKLFTFWWPNAKDTNYFNVSITPKYDNAHNDMIPLVEVRREWEYVIEGLELRHQFNLTLLNNNDFTVRFEANHLLVH